MINGDNKKNNLKKIKYFTTVEIVNHGEKWRANCYIPWQGWKSNI